MSIVAVDYPIANRLLLKATGIVDVPEITTAIAVHRGGPARFIPILFDLTEATVNVSAAQVASLADMMALEMKRPLWALWF